jgi:hypothetical protein
MKFEVNSFRRTEDARRGQLASIQEGLALAAMMSDIRIFRYSSANVQDRSS